MPVYHDASVPWLIRKLHATVADEIASSVLFFTSIAVVVTVVSKETSFQFEVEPTMLAVLSTMISFAITLRTNSALDRYNEGRRAWSGIGLACRNLAILIWLHVPVTTLTAKELADLEKSGGMTEAREERERAKALIEKRTIINLLDGFAVACKHYLRGEGGIYYDDLYHILKGLPKYAFKPNNTDDHASALLGLWRSPHDDGQTAIPFHPTDHLPPQYAHSPHMALNISQTSVAAHSAKSATPTLHPLRPAFTPPKTTIYTVFPPLVLFRPLVRWFSSDPGRRERAQRGHSSTLRRKAVGPEVPLEISMFISTWFSKVFRRKTMDPPYTIVTFNALNSLQEALHTLERVHTTPLPFAYQVHLKASIWAFLAVLPVQIYDALGWVTIPATTISATVYLGFLEIADQVESPFGYDDSDLDLDHYCSLIAAELREIVAHPQPDPEVTSPLNQPFWPTDERSAAEILKDYDSAAAEQGGSTSSQGDGECRVCGEAGVRRLAAHHFHRMEGLAEVEREMQRKGIKKEDKGGQEVEVVLV